MIHIFGRYNSVAQALNRRSDLGTLRLHSVRGLALEDVGDFIDPLATPGATFVYTAGLLRPKKFNAQTQAEVAQSFLVNLWLPMAMLERLNQDGCAFRFVYVSSESALKGSYDGAYFMAKAAAERFIQETRLRNLKSSCVAVAPSTIEDSSMTQNRQDLDRVQQYREAHPKERFLMADEVAEVIASLISLRTDYLSNCVVPVNGGKFARSVI
jgi:NAD(P)-dependent dehydrogenase (short-subunit alcohol dehydrogenase family)